MKKPKYKLVTGEKGLGYIDVYERTKKYFKAKGVFRKRRYFHGEAHCTRKTIKRHREL